jgi:FtsH-binding integral membrane protein
MPSAFRSRSQAGWGPTASFEFTRDQTRGVFGQVMGLVTLTLGFLALGAYVGRNMAGGSGFLFILLGFGAVIGLQYASARGREQLAIGLLFALGLLFGLAFAPILALYAKADPSALYEAAGSTALFCGALGAFGYSSRRDLSGLWKAAFIGWGVLMVFGIVAIFVAIPHANIIWGVLGLAVFGAFTVIDFNRLRRTSMGGAVPIAASIFLDIFNVFLFMLSLFGGGGQRR